MKLSKPITLWDKIHQAITDLSEDEIVPETMTDQQVVDRLIELAHHYRLECKKLQDELEEITWQ